MGRRQGAGRATPILASPSVTSWASRIEAQLPRKGSDTEAHEPSLDDTETAQVFQRLGSPRFGARACVPGSSDRLAQPVLVVGGDRMQGFAGVAVV